ncbi:Tnks [Symbiodinium sp. CCMP2456]|nr:Tnks [Symbiodinium sp. CCMP2456]
MGSDPCCCRCGAGTKTGSAALWDDGWWFWIKDATEEWCTVLKLWQPMSSWLRQQLNASSSNATKIYCERCWKVWGRYVKPGCQHALSSKCEELANRLGVEINDDDNCHRQKSNPFKCKLCDRLLNAGTLYSHLQFQHSSCQQTCKPVGGQVSLQPRVDLTQADVQPVVPTSGAPTVDLTQTARAQPVVFKSGSPAWRQPKRKLAATPISLQDDAQTADVPPVVRVSGCSSTTASRIIKGTYTRSEWHHGKPVYRKVREDGDEIAVLIFYWDGRDDPSFQGWWFAPKVGSEMVWAHCETAVESRSPPVSGWKVPYDGHVDNELKITKDSEPDKALAVEGVWEFLSSEVGGAEDWQPMSYEMQKSLEDCWARGWKGHNGSDILHVRANGYAYRIDCSCMVQWNVKTNRRRPIRRQQKNDEAALSQLEGLKNEIRRHVDENAALTSKVVDLEAQLLQLKAVQSRAEHTALMTLQEPWRMSRQLDMTMRVEVHPEDGLFAALQKSLLSAFPSGHHGECSAGRGLTITRVEQIQNIRLWKSYEFRKEQVKKELEGQTCPRISSSFSSCQWAKLDPTVNEVLVLHGTVPDNVDLIANFGFDERLARERGLYGQGVYFTDQTCKAFQYSGASKQGNGCFIITRLILGDPHYAQGPLQKTKVEPLRDPKDPSKGRCHSVIASSGTPSGNGARQVHRELVIFNGAQAYPEMIVHIRK